jgi:hypothetical protein
MNKEFTQEDFEFNTPEEIAIFNKIKKAKEHISNSIKIGLLQEKFETKELYDELILNLTKKQLNQYLDKLRIDDIGNQLAFILEFLVKIIQNINEEFNEETQQAIIEAIKKQQKTFNIITENKFNSAFKKII